MVKIMQTEFIAKRRSLLKTFVLSNLAILLIHLLSLNKGGLPKITILIFNLIFLYIWMEDSVTKMIFANAGLTVESVKWNKPIRQIFPYQSLVYYFGIEIKGRGSTAKTLNIQSSGKKILKLAPGISGFSEDEIKEIIRLLESNGVPEIAQP